MRHSRPHRDTRTPPGSTHATAPTTTPTARAKRATGITLLAALLATGCSEDFAPYNLVTGFRLLAISADDPWLAPFSDTTLRALVTPDDSQDEVRYAWSWCPLTLGAPDSYECALSRDELQAQIDAAGGGITVPPYELGTTSTVTFSYPVPSPVIVGLCDAIQGGDIPDVIALPECDNGYPAVIRLEVTQGDQTLVGIKEVNLLFEAVDQPNSNPTATGLIARRVGTDEMIRLAATGTTTLDRGAPYGITVEIDPSQAEPTIYRPPDGSAARTRPERLTFSWFVTAGDTRFQRTGILEDQVSLEEAARNRWFIPLRADFEDESAEILIVIRDGRRGTSWIRRRVTLTP